MTSNDRFDAASVMTNIAETTLSKRFTTSESETDDEEVCMNCVGGFRGVEDSDMNTTENSDDEEEDDVLTDDEASRDGFRIINFVAKPCKSEMVLICPKPKVPVIQRLSPLIEVEDEPEISNEQTNVVIDTNSSNSIDASSNNLEVDSCDTGILLEEHDMVEESIIDPSPQCLEAELTEIMVSIGDALELVLDESESSSRRCYLGVMKDMETSVTFTRGPKRVHCQHRNECVNEVYKKARSVTIDLPTSTAHLSSLNSILSMKIREDSPVLMSSDDDDDLDRQLGEELGDQYQGGRQEEALTVPLLTPPGSPLTVDWEGAATTLCEWPSNLIVDSALQAVNELRPMSPTSLENLERDEHDRIVAFSSSGSSSGGNEFMMMMVTPTTSMLKSVFLLDTSMVPGVVYSNP